MEQKESKKLTIEEAKAQGYKMFFSEHNDDNCYPLEDARDFRGEKLYLAKAEDSINLNAADLISWACEELFEGAEDRVYGTDEFKAFKEACEAINTNLKDDTQCYSITDIELLIPQTS